MQLKTINGKTGILDRLVLNDVQRNAVVHNDGPQLVFAGAGTGKTRVLTAKIAHLLDQGMHPSCIFAATFTNKAANEMRERIEHYISRPVSGMWIGTFHSLCVRILRSECHHIGYPSTFTIYDTSDQTALIKKAMKRMEIDDRNMTPRQIASVISTYKNRCLSPNEALKQVVGFFGQEHIRLYAEYQRLLKEQQAMDFDDLLMQVVTLLRSHKKILEKYQQRFNYILIDEYQDTNLTQLNLVKLLSAHHHKLFAVGDDDQSIYGWRGAQIENILHFKHHFPQATTFILEQNYRSTTAILNFANNAIAGNCNRAIKNLWTSGAAGEPVTIIRYRDDRQEAEEIALKTAALCKSESTGGDIAVLFRTNAQSRIFEDTFRKKQIPYILIGATSFYERAEIKDLLAYCTLLVNPAVDVAFERIFNTPSRGLGEKALQSLQEYAVKNRCSLLTALLRVEVGQLGSRFKKGFSELKELFAHLIDLVRQGVASNTILNELLHLSGYIDMLTRQHTEESAGRLENCNELLNDLTEWTTKNPDKQLSDFLDNVSLRSDIDDWNNKGTVVNLMTMHCAKGLEFKHVFLVGVEDGIIPSRLNIDDDAKIEEERRLLYVGATRAMKTLCCSYVDRRSRFGEVSPQTPSRFLRDINPSLYIPIDKSFDLNYDVSKNHPPKTPSIKQYTRTHRHTATTVSGSNVSPSGNKYNHEYDTISQMEVQYRMGQHVRHKKYGPGKIVNISGFGPDMKLIVLFNDGARRNLMARFAKFET